MAQQRNRVAPGGGFGPDYLPERVVRMIIFARLTNYIEGHAKTRSIESERIAQMLDNPLPKVPLSGQVGAGEILLTSMDRDGTREGFDIALTRQIADSVSIPVVASGGVGTLEHLVEGIRSGHAAAVLAASIFHFGVYSISEAKTYIDAAGISIRR